MPIIFNVFLIVLLYLKMTYHWRYFVIVYDIKQRHFNDYIYDQSDNAIDFFIVTLKFILPFFFREVLDVSSEESELFRKRVLLLILVWWIAFILGLGIWVI